MLFPDWMYITIKKRYIRTIDLIRNQIWSFQGECMQCMPGPVSRSIEAFPFEKNEV